MQERRPKRRRKYDSECPCPKGEPKTMGLTHVPKHPNPVPGPKARQWRTTPPTYTPPPREARAPASPPPSPPTGQPTQANTATAAPARPHVDWTSWDANEAWWNQTREAWWTLSSWPTVLTAPAPEHTTSSSTAASSTAANSTSSGTSASGVAADVQRHKIPVAPNQVKWLPLPDGTFKLDCKISPVAEPHGMRFRGYDFEGNQAFAFFSPINPDEDGVRRPRPRGGKHNH